MSIMSGLVVLDEYYESSEQSYLPKLMRYLLRTLGDIIFIYGTWSIVHLYRVAASSVYIV